MFAAGADDFRVLPLLEGKFGVQQQAGHANHAIERSADFVAHVGQELALGHIRGLGAATGLHQFGDVNRIEQHAIVMALPVNRLEAQDDFAGGELTLDDDGGGGGILAELFDGLVDPVRNQHRMQRPQILAEQILPIETGQPAEPLIHLDDGVAGIREHDTFIHAGNHGGQLGRLARAVFLGAFALGIFLEQQLVVEFFFLHQFALAGNQGAHRVQQEGFITLVLFRGMHQPGHFGGKIPHQFGQLIQGLLQPQVGTAERIIQPVALRRADLQGAVQPVVLLLGLVIADINIIQERDKHLRRDLFGQLTQLDILKIKLARLLRLQPQPFPQLYAEDVMHPI